MTSATHRLPRVVGALALSGILIAMTPARADENWSPKASEQLIKLPGDHLKRAVENDLARSGLAASLSTLQGDIALKKQTLADLQNAVDRADGELRVELQHQFLEEKRAFIEMMKRDQDLREKRARTKVKLYEQILAKIRRTQGTATPQQKLLIAQQSAARERFEASAAAVDTKLLQSSITSESRYAREYANNIAAIETLSQAIQAHPMNQSPQIGGVPIDREEYLRQLITDNEADVAVIDQERTILGYMAKLVSLDALALSENIADGGDAVLADAQDDEKPGVAAAVDLFVGR